MSLVPSSTLYIGQLDDRVTHRILYDLCCQAGKVIRIHIPLDNGRSKGFGFCQYETIESAVYAYGLFKGLLRLFGRQVDVSFSRSGVTHKLDELSDDVQALFRKSQNLHAEESAARRNALLASAPGRFPAQAPMGSNASLAAPFGGRVSLSDHGSPMQQFTVHNGLLHGSHSNTPGSDMMSLSRMDSVGGYSRLNPNASNVQMQYGVQNLVPSPQQYANGAQLASVGQYGYGGYQQQQQLQQQYGKPSAYVLQPAAHPGTPYPPPLPLDTPPSIPPPPPHATPPGSHGSNPSPSGSGLASRSSLGYLVPPPPPPALASLTTAPAQAAGVVGMVAIAPAAPFQQQQLVGGFQYANTYQQPQQAAYGAATYSGGYAGAQAYGHAEQYQGQQQQQQAQGLSQVYQPVQQQQQDGAQHYPGQQAAYGYQQQQQQGYHQQYNQWPQQ